MTRRILFLIKYGEIKSKEYKPLNEDTLTFERWKKRISRDVKLSDTIKRTENGKISSFNTPYLKDDRTPATIAAGGSPPLRFDVPGYVSDEDLIKIQTFPLDFLQWLLPAPVLRLRFRRMLPVYRQSR